ncbi:glucose-6-phosphate dehydrogenase [bacterium]|nr:glucose-6-phosphate dehydrogenase [bacterium]
MSGAESETEPFVMIIFGGAGDLSRRKLLPALYHLFADCRLPADFLVYGIGRRPYTDRSYRELVSESLKAFVPDLYKAKTAREFAAHCLYEPGPSNDETLYQRLCARIQKDSKTRSNVLFYLAVPPALLPQIVSGLKKVLFCHALENSKIIIEKPFGQDRKTAHQLNAMLLDVFDENRIYRIDHYLGKETVQNILFFRFGNSIFEPLWNHKYIDHVQITVAEDLGIGHRGDFYEQTGVVRDLVQNHILQLLSLVAMEPPVGFEGNWIRDEKIKVYRSVRPVTGKTMDKNTVRGQYGPGRIRGISVPGYRGEDRVSRHSNTPTFFACRLFIDNWRWAGVPFYIRTGKRLPMQKSEIYIQFNQPPLKLFGPDSNALEPGGLMLSIQPEEEIALRLNVKYPGMGNRPHPVTMELNYTDAFGTVSRPAYERLLIDTIKGDLTLFARMDGVEAMWGIVDPIITWWDARPAGDFPNYRAGTWGPEKSDRLLQKDGRMWRNFENDQPGVT